MSSEDKPTVRRSSRSASTASPIKDALASPLPASHPIGREEPEAPAPKSTSRVQAAAPPASKKNGSKATSSGVGAFGPLALVVAVLAVGAGVWYSQFYAQPPRKQRREPLASALLEAGIETIPQPVPASPPLPPITAEEAAVFEQAAAEHYGMSPGMQPGHGVVLERRSELEVAAADTNTAADAGTVNNLEVAGTGDDAAAAAAQTFDPAVHQQYLDLPVWPPTTREELTGSWNLTEAIYDYAANLPMTQVLSWEEPRVMLFPSFLAPEEVGHMVTVSRENLERSEVLVEEGEETLSDIRTSFGFWPDSDAVTERITERIHRTIGIPERFGEGLYVLNYQIGQKYEAHNDHCMDGYMDNKVADPACRDFLKRAGGPECGPGKGGPTCGDRVATFILYLKSPTKGGQTAFPDAEATKQAMGDEHRPGNSPNSDWYCHDERVLAAAPPAGTGVLFWDYRPGSGANVGSYLDGSADPLARTVYGAMHSGCPVEEGEKYVMTRWIRGAGFDVPRP